MSFSVAAGATSSAARSVRNNSNNNNLGATTCTTTTTTTTATAASRNVSDMVAPDPPADLRPVYDTDNAARLALLLKTPTRMNYVSPDTVKASIQRDPNGFDSVTRGALWQEETVWVENGRLQPFQLHTSGFELVVEQQQQQQQEEENLAGAVPTDIDFLSKDDVLDRYYPHCEQLLERHLEGKVRVWAFDHNVRKQQQQQGETTQKPLGLVHGDYTTVSGPRRLQLLAEPPRINDVWRERLSSNNSSSTQQQEQQQQQPLLDPVVVQECLDGTRRYALINIWRNIDTEHPVLSLPLGCVDARTHSAEDLRVLEVHYKDRIGENFLVCPAEAHRWVYFPEMVYSECLLIKQWDSAGDFAQTKDRDDALFSSTFSIHSAFQDPTTPADAPSRQSIEVRCVAIWEPDDERS